MTEIRHDAPTTARELLQALYLDDIFQLAPTEASRCLVLEANRCLRVHERARARQVR